MIGWFVVMPYTPDITTHQTPLCLELCNYLIYRPQALVDGNENGC